MLKVKCFTLGELGANCFFVIDEESKDAFVVDPGDVSSALNEAIDSHGADRLKYILLTHGHFDHTGALHAFAGTPIYMHPSDDVMLLDPV